MPLNRRAFLKTSALTTAVFVLPRRAQADYGDLLRDPEGVLDLPYGFSYSVLDSRGEAMDDGYKVPGKPTGIACVEDADGNWVLIRNHELDDTDSLIGPYDSGQSPSDAAYDPDALGGVSRMVIDPSTLSIVSRNMLLLGTIENGGGATSPWGWLSAERTVTSNHGFVFLCDPESSLVESARPLASCGRFRHGGAAVDNENRVYLSEDRPQGSFYRMTPQQAADPFSGTLETLIIAGENNLDTSAELGMGDVVAVEWVAIEEPNPE
ncbi:MAG: alkaline phosphatase PhoX, partial [Myxococcota bacterium]|nr:alkaline phosphatase PhoX [Myxococcota bacterium]